MIGNPQVMVQLCYKRLYSDIVTIILLSSVAMKGEDANGFKTEIFGQVFQFCGHFFKLWVTTYYGVLSRLNFICYMYPSNSVGISFVRVKVLSHHCGAKIVLNTSKKMTVAMELIMIL